MPGPPPKSTAQRRRRNKDPNDRVLSAEIVAAEPVAFPVDVVNTQDGIHPMALEFWHEVMNSPMAAEWDASDMHGLYMLVDLYNTYWNCPPEKFTSKSMLAAEIRLQRQAYGLSPMDRRRLHWVIENTEQAQDAGARRRAERQQISRPDPRMAYEVQE